ncbi:hypothetical protein [Mesorhizobium sp. M0898]|uniref:hypothetical protein n=1 Tax=Mesorhizobium sp. M0898 TaxID=2957020 RepID=UPI00333D7CE2
MLRGEVKAFVLVYVQTIVGKVAAGKLAAETGIALLPKRIGVHDIPVHKEALPGSLVLFHKLVDWHSLELGDEPLIRPWFVLGHDRIVRIGSLESAFLWVGRDIRENIRDTQSPNERRRSTIVSERYSMSFKNTSILVFTLDGSEESNMRALGTDGRLNGSTDVHQERSEKKIQGLPKMKILSKKPSPLEQ